MKKIILKIILLAIFSAAVLSCNGGLQAQTFVSAKYDSLTLIPNKTQWIALPSGITALEVNADSASYVGVAFTTYGKRKEQRKDSVNVIGKIKRGQTRWFYDRDNDSVGFKGTGKIYYWIHRGAGNPTYFNNPTGATWDSIANEYLTASQSNAKYLYKSDSLKYTFDRDSLTQFVTPAMLNNKADTLPGKSGFNTWTGYQIYNAPSLTGSSATSIFNITQTWNTSGAPTALKMNITNTASNSASLLMDLQVGGNSKFKVDKDGFIFLNGNQWGGNTGNINYYYSGSSAMNFYNNAGTTKFLDINNTSGQVAVTPATLTGSSATSGFSIAQTWNTSGNPTALSMNITNTSSGSTAKIFDYMISSASKLSLSKNGLLTLVGDFRWDGTTSSSANAGINGDVPAQVDGYIVINISGTNYKIPYYSN